MDSGYHARTDQGWYEEILSTRLVNKCEKESLHWVQEQAFRVRIVSGKCGETGVPLPPTPFKCLDWRGFCKGGLQNLEPLGVRGQNLKNKGLAVFLVGAADIASALTMICSLDFEVKEMSHTSVVEENRKPCESNMGNQRAGTRHVGFCKSAIAHTSGSMRVKGIYCQGRTINPVLLPNALA
jgi:hypothetical protein